MDGICHHIELEVHSTIVPKESIRRKQKWRDQKAKYRFTAATYGPHQYV